MAKWYGAIGYVETAETEPGVWEEKVTERYYYGESVRSISKFQTSDSVNDDISVTNELSVVADPYAIQNFYFIRYVDCMGTRWKVNSVEIKYPRLILSIGGLYNGCGPSESPDETGGDSGES